MAIFHWEAQIIARGQGKNGRCRSVLAAAAYRAAERLEDKRNREVFDYRNKRGVSHREILAPASTAAWLTDRAKLWNHVEKLEKRRDAQLAREINIALPHELNAEQRLELIRSYVLAEFVSLGMVADLTLHDPVAGGGDDRHFHAHILLTLREAHGGGLSRRKCRAWNSDDFIRRWREQWALHANRALRLAGFAARIDHRSLLEQRDDAIRRGDDAAAFALDRRPQIAVGPEAMALEGRGYLATPRNRTLRTRGGKKRERRYTETDRGSRAAFNAAILRQNARKASAYAALYRLQERKLAKRLTLWRREALRRQQQARAERREQQDARQRAFAALSLTHILHRWGLATKAHVIAARRAAWATLSEAERLEAERRFAARLARYKGQRQAAARGRCRARRPTDR